MAFIEISTQYKYVNLPDPTGQRDPRPTDAKAGDVVVTGTYVGLSRPMGEYNTQNLLFKEASGSTVSLSAAAQLKYAVQDGRIKVGDMIRLTYTGIMIPKQKPGGKRPKPQHSFKVEINLEQRVEMAASQHQQTESLLDKYRNNAQDESLPEELQDEETNMQAPTPINYHRVPTQTTTTEHHATQTHTTLSSSMTGDGSARVSDANSVLNKYRNKVSGTTGT